MNIVTHIHENEIDQSLVMVPELPMLQARLAKDGTDDDIKLAFSDAAIKRANVSDKTARLKALVRKGIQAEQHGVVKENDDFIFDGDDLIPVTNIIVAQIGSNRVVMR